MRSVMSHNFSQVPQAKIPRSVFKRDHAHKTTFDAGYLIPVLVDEALPGDTFNCKMNFFGRLATPLAPIMDNIFLDSFFFAVPYRLLWSNFKKFMGEQVDPGDSTDYTIPVLDDTAAPLSTTGFVNSSVYDYMGLPTEVTDIENISALPLRAYYAVWNDWFRDQNLQDSLDFNLTDGPDDPADYALQRRGKRHDYFTSCLPWAQKGNSVTLSMSGTAPVLPGSSEHTTAGNATAMKMRITTSGSFSPQNTNMGIGSTTGEVCDGTGTFLGGSKLYPTNLEADLSSAVGNTINEIRNAFQVQRMYERDARGGTRYIEIIRSHFGVISPDSRMQRPEYLGGGSSRINIHPVANTSEDTTNKQGELTGFGTVSGVGHGFVKSFTEHCVILGLVSVRADLTYQEGLNRMWSRQTRHDFYWPTLAHLGEQAVLNKEIYCDGTSADDNVFGYNERFAEYRYKPSQISGRMRSNYTSSLDLWHCSQEFGTLPTLNSTFITDNPPLDRNIATPTEPHIIFDSYFDYKCARPMPTYSAPGLIDHL
jgi:hypothetical protein